jgi:speckle-type POZ protein
VAPGSVDVDGPPSDLHRHLGDLLRGETGADVVFEVGGERFASHRCVLDARSSVFDLELFGATTTKEVVVGQSTGIVRFDGMEARVFKALLFFAYTDSLPEMMTTTKKKMEEQAAGDGDDRYDIDAFTVGKVIALAEQHDCRVLRKLASISSCVVLDFRRMYCWAPATAAPSAAPFLLDKSCLKASSKSGS